MSRFHPPISPDRRVRLEIKLGMSNYRGAMAPITAALRKGIPRLKDVSVEMVGPGHGEIRLELPWWSHLTFGIAGRRARREAIRIVEDIAPLGVRYDFIVGPASHP